MRLLMTIAALGIAAPAAAADTSVTAPIEGFITAFNKGDMKAVAATMTAGGASIIDEFAPHYWVGSTAIATWAADYASDATTRGITGGKVVLGQPTRTEMSPGSAYVIVPATYTFKQHGTAMVENGAMTFALKGKAKMWKIAGWTWSGPTPHAVK